MGTPARSGKPSPQEAGSESSSSKLSESVLTLRVAREMVLPLRTSTAADQPMVQIPVRTKAVGTEALVVPFRISKRLTDRETGQKFGVTLAIEPSLVPDRVKVSVGSDAKGQGPVRKVALQDAASGEEQSSMPVREQRVELDATLPYGFYVVELFGDKHSLCRFPFTVEPFSLPEALAAADEYLSQFEYVRAVTILEDAATRYPDSSEVWDLLSVVEELATVDLETVEKEEQEEQEEPGEQEVGVFRGPRVRFRGIGTVLQTLRSKFGESVASLLVARKLDPESVPDARLTSLTEVPVSLPVLQALSRLEQRVKEMSEEAHRRDERLEQALAGVTGRLGQLEACMLDVDQRLNAIRADQDHDADEKFALVGELLIRLVDRIHSGGVSLPDFAPFFQEKLGESCWKWIGKEAQRMFVSAEDVYWYFASSAMTRKRDFTPALLEFCRGFELLLNSRLGKVCEAIRNLIRGNPQLTDFVDQELTWANSADLSKFSRSYSIPQIAIALRLGKAVRQKYPELLSVNTTANLALSGFTDDESIAVLTHIGLIFRNGKVHPYSGSHRMFTMPEEVQILRKLLFGLDEERLTGDEFFSELNSLRSFSRSEIKQVVDSLSSTWPKFPGLVPRLWRTSEQAVAA